MGSESESVKGTATVMAMVTDLAAGLGLVTEKVTEKVMATVMEMEMETEGAQYERSESGLQPVDLLSCCPQRYCCR